MVNIMISFSQNIGMYVPNHITLLSQKTVSFSFVSNKINISCYMNYMFVK